MKKYMSVKSILGRMLAFITIILLSPLLVLISIWVKLDSKGPILFKQRRIGKNKKEFYILKFRTMKTETPKDMPTHLLENPDYFLTRSGKILRKTSLDELPQLINILKGEMCFIGPRPALWNQYDLIAERDLYGANDVLPGLSGLAQVSGRDELEIAVKAAYDGEYVKKVSLWLDIKIVFLTIFNVVISKGVVEGKQEAQSKEQNLSV